MQNNIFTPLKNKDFRWLFASQIFNKFVMFLDYVAIIALIVFVWHKGATVLAVFSVVFAFPMIFISPIAGILSDRLPIKTIMIITTFLCCPLTLGLVFSSSVFYILIIVIIRGTLKLFYDPCEIKVVREFFEDDGLPNANALMQMISQLSKIIGPAIAGLLLLYFLPRDIFIIASICFLISSVLLFKLPSSLNELHKIDSDQKKNGYTKDIVEGFFVYIYNTELLLALIGLSIAYFCIFLSDSMTSLLAKYVGFHMSSFGWIMAMVGVGGLLGSILSSSLSAKIRPLTLLNAALVFIGIAVILSSALSMHLGVLSLPFFLMMWLCVGVGIVSVSIAFQVIIQREMPQKMLGRGSAVINVMTGVSMLFAPMLGAALANSFGVVLLFVITGVGVCSVGIVMQRIYLYLQKDLVVEQ